MSIQPDVRPVDQVDGTGRPQIAHAACGYCVTVLLVDPIVSLCRQDTVPRADAWIVDRSEATNVQPCVVCIDLIPEPCPSCGMRGR